MNNPGALLWGFLLVVVFNRSTMLLIYLNYNIHYVK